MQLLGVVENMSSEVLRTGGRRAARDRLGVRLLGEVPLDADSVPQPTAGVPLSSRTPAASAPAITAIAERSTRARRRLHAHPAARLLSEPARRVPGLPAGPGRDPEAEETVAAARPARVLGRRGSRARPTIFSPPSSTGRPGHGLARVTWLEGWPELETDARPLRARSEAGYERWEGNGALGYLVLHAVVEAQLADPPATARVVVAGETFPTGMLGYWTRRLADGGLVAALTATSPRRLGHPGGRREADRHEPPLDRDPGLVRRADRDRRLDGQPDLRRCARRPANEEELAPFGGAQAHKDFALAVGLQLLVDALTPEEDRRRPARRPARG